MKPFPGYGGNYKHKLQKASCRQTSPNAYALLHEGVLVNEIFLRGPFLASKVTSSYKMHVAPRLLPHGHQAPTLQDGEEEPRVNASVCPTRGIVPWEPISCTLWPPPLSPLSSYLRVIRGDYMTVSVTMEAAQGASGKRRSSERALDSRLARARALAFPRARDSRGRWQLVGESRRRPREVSCLFHGMSGRARGALF